MDAPSPSTARNELRLHGWSSPVLSRLSHLSLPQWKKAHREVHVRILQDSPLRPP